MHHFSIKTFLLITCLFCTLLNADDATKKQSLADIRGLLLSKQVLSARQNETIAQFFLNRYQNQKIDFSQGQHRCLIQRTDDGGGYAGWFLKAPAGKQVTIYADKQRHWPMRALGKTGYFARVEKFPNFSAVYWRIDINGRRLPFGRQNQFGFASYKFGPDSKKQPGVPVGKLIAMPQHTSRLAYPGSVRDWWVYVPAQYKQSDPPAKLIIFNDGKVYSHGVGNACIVMDNLIHQGKIPVMIALFIQPGKITNAAGKPISNRSNEYDTCTPQFATFLEKEIFPIVNKKYNISSKPEDHAILGASSGGSCAFTAAWHRPDLFRKVVSFIGSFDDFRSLDDYPSFAGKKNNIPLDKFGPWKTAHDYPGLIRKTDPPKPIKVYLQDGDNDLDNRLGNWFLNNERMAAALAFSGYDYTFVTDHGLHSYASSKPIMPETLTWIWSDTIKK